MIELLIKIGSNTDIRVRCNNEKEYHFFTDPAGTATQCPVCGDKNLLRFQNLAWQDGDIIDAHVGPWKWSPVERQHVVQMSNAEVSKMLTAPGVSSEADICTLLRRKETQEITVGGIIKHLTLKRRQYRISVSPKSDGVSLKRVKASEIEVKP
jgi:hypothetical protein